MEAAGAILGLLVIVVIAIIVIVGAGLIISAVYDAFKAVPEISEELTKIRELLEKKE